MAIVYSVTEAGEFGDGYFPTLAEAKDAARNNAKCGLDAEVRRHVVSSQGSAREIACRLLNNHGWSETSEVVFTVIAKVRP